MPEGIVKDLVLFYIDFFRGVAKSVRILAKIQENHKDEYKNLKEIQIDPTKIYDLMNKMNNDNKKTMLDLMLRTQLLQMRFTKVFDMNPKEQKALAKDIDTYLEEFKNFYGEADVVDEK